MASTSSSIMDLFDGECADPTASRKRRRRRNKHVNPQSQRNLVKPPPPPPKCVFKQPSLVDPDCWVVLVHLTDEERLHEFDEQLPQLAAKAGLLEAILRSHGFTRLVYVAEEEDTKAKELARALHAYSAVVVGRTHKPYLRERTLEVHGLPDGIGVCELTEALDCQFPGKGHLFDVLESVDPRREPDREVLIVTRDASMFHHLLNNGGLKFFDDRLTFRCTERASEAAAAARKWKKKRVRVVPEAERQCFKCLEYGHMAEACERPARCKRCAGPHAFRDCPGGDGCPGATVCVNCGAEGHRAVSRSCPLRPGQKTSTRALKVRTGAASEGEQDSSSSPSSSPSPSPSETYTDSSGLLAPVPAPRAVCSCADPEQQRSVSLPAAAAAPQSRGAAGQTAPESRSEDDAAAAAAGDADFAAEASTEEPRDSPVMASSAAPTASPRDNAAAPDFTPGGVSSTTGEAKAKGDSEGQVAAALDAAASTDEKEDPETNAAIKDEENQQDTKENELKEDVNSSNVEDDADKENVGDGSPEGDGRTSDDSEEEGQGEGVLFFTGSKDGDREAAEAHSQSCQTADAVAGFFSDLFGAAEAPRKPLDERFVATLRSLQESVYADIVARHPRRGATSPRERKPAKKRRLLESLMAAAASREAHTQTAARPARASPSPAAKVLGSPLSRLRAAAVADGAETASRSLSERRLRVLEQFLRIVGAILEI